MIRLSTKDNNLIVNSDSGDLTPNNESQLAYWGFRADSDSLQFIAPANNAIELAMKVCKYFEKRNLLCELTPHLKELFEKRRLVQQELYSSLLRGSELKEGELSKAEVSEFQVFLNEKIPRKLKEHQFKSGLHLLSVKNGANFSAPGSGKTTVVLSVFHMLRQKNLVDALFVVGPPACFSPWQNEYEEVLGLPPKVEVLAGGDIHNRHSKYFVNIESVRDLYLTSFQTLSRDYTQVCTLFNLQGIRFFYVVDEAHYIKKLDGEWASAALQVARFATRRCILTGTPFPGSYSDAFNLFDVLWPESPPVSPQNKQSVVFYVNRKEYDRAADILRESIDPLFYRVRKSELGLAPQVFVDPILIRMNEREKRVYDAILDKIKNLSESEYFRDLNLTLRLRRGRMIRLRQCLSYTKLLSSAIDEYDEDLCKDDLSLAKLIHEYDEFEIPKKLEILIQMAGDFHSKGEKILIWSNFVKTLELIKHTLVNFGYKAHLIYGATPLERTNDNIDEITREKCIREFVSEKSGIDILVANPAACAESISLHKTCSNAIYYDLSYNCAQYLQSLDRIHRVGGSENKKAYYHFLQYENTLDQDILRNLNAKAERMSKIIDQDYPIYSLDMFNQDEEVDLYDKFFNGKS